MVVKESGTQKKIASIIALHQYKPDKRYLGRNLEQSQPMTAVPTQEPKPRIETDQAILNIRIFVYWMDGCCSFTYQLY
jgi:hypothetical protein